MSRHTQYDFSGGEIADEVKGRRETDMYRKSLARLRNWTTAQTGAVSNREGGEYVGKEKRDFAHLAYLDIGTMFATNPMRLTITAHGLETGDLVSLEGFNNTPEVERRDFVITKTTNNDFTIDGEDATGYTISTSGRVWLLKKSSVHRAIKFDGTDEDSDYSLYFGDKVIMPLRDGEHVLDHRESLDVQGTDWTITDMTAAKPILATLSVGSVDLIPGDEIILSQIPASAGDWARLSGTRHRISFPLMGPPDIDPLPGNVVEMKVNQSFNPIRITVDFDIDQGYATFQDFWAYFYDLDEAKSPKYKSHMSMAEYMNNRWWRMKYSNAGAVQAWVIETFQSVRPGDPWKHLPATIAGFTGKMWVRDHVAHEIYLDGSDAVGWTGVLSGAFPGKIQVIESPYLAADIAGLTFSQDGEGMSITSPNHVQRELTRTPNEATIHVAEDWLLEEQRFIPDVRPPDTLTPDVVAGEPRRIAVTTVERETGAESSPRYRATNGAAKNTLELVPNPDSDPFEFNVYVTLEDTKKFGFSELSDQDEFDFANDNNFAPNYSSRPPEHYNPFEEPFIEVDVTGVTLGGAGVEPVIKMSTAVSVAIGQQKDLSRIFLEGLDEPTELNRRYLLITMTIVNEMNIFGEDSESLSAWTSDGSFTLMRQTRHPTAVGFWAQRQIYARGQELFCCKTGSRGSFEQNIPVRSTDAFRFALAESKNEILFLVGTKHLLALTRGGIFAISDINGPSLTPANISASRDYIGSIAPVAPVFVNRRVLFATVAGPTIRDLSFDGDTTQYAGANLSLLARHMLDGYSIVDMTYTSDPDTIVWVVRSDGHVVAFTYSAEHKVFGWHDHDTPGGKYESVVAIREGQKDSRYDVVLRHLPGEMLTRYFERRQPRALKGDVRKGFILDCGVREDDPQSMNPLAETPLKTVFNDGARATPFAYAVDDYYDMDHWVQKDGKRVPGNHHKKQYKIKLFQTSFGGDFITWKDSSDVNVVGTDVLDDQLDEFNIRFASNTLEHGLQHLIGQTVDVFANGIYYSALVVSQYGVITLPGGVRASQWSVGFRYDCDLQTLQPESSDPDLPSAIGKVEETRKPILLMLDTVKGSVGPDLERIRSLAKETEAKFLNELKMFTDYHEADSQSARNDGTIFYRQLDPTPVTLLAIVTLYSDDEEERAK